MARCSRWRERSARGSGSLRSTKLSRHRISCCGGGRPVGLYGQAHNIPPCPSLANAGTRFEATAAHHDQNGPVTRAALAHRLRRVLEIGCLPTDSDQERVAKEVFVVTGLGAALAGVVWAVMYAALGKPLSSLIPLVITVGVVAIFARFVETKTLGLLPVPFLALGILLPLLLQLSLGGYVHGSAVVMWAFMAPLFSLLLRPA